MGVLIPEARHFILPGGIVSTEGPSLNAICTEVGIPLSPWQRALTEASGAKGAEGLYAAETVVASIPRQAGKTHWARAYVFAQCIKHPGTLVAWTAHHTKVAAESFASLKSLALTEKLAPHIDRVAGARGAEEIVFTNGSRIVMAARERAGLRGFAKVRIIVLDEAQKLTEAAMSDMVPTMNQAWNPQLILMGTPPRPRDEGDVFAERRREAIEADELGEEPDSILYVETSADGDAETDDRAQWRKANLSFPDFTPVRAMLRMRRELVEDDFRREALGIWDDLSVRQVIDADSWAAVGDTGSVPLSRLVLAVDVDPDQSRASVALAGLREDGLTHMELYEQRSGTGWLAPWIAERAALPTVAAVVVDAKSPAAPLVDELKRRKVRNVVTTSADDMATACAIFYSAVMERTARHTDQPQVNVALASASKRALGDRWAWNRKTATADITPLVAMTLAHWGVQTSKVKRRDTGSRGRGGVL